MPVCDLTMCFFISVCVSFSTLTSLRPNSTYITVSHRKESFINSQREETFSNLRGKSPILPFLTLCLKKKREQKQKSVTSPAKSSKHDCVSCCSDYFLFIQEKVRKDFQRQQTQRERILRAFHFTCFKNTSNEATASDQRIKPTKYRTF